MLRSIRCFSLVDCFLIESKRVTSSGEDSLSPHCSWFGKCEYNDHTKQECAEALCIAQGYTTGIFQDASNNFCTTGIAHSGKIWVYGLSMSTWGSTYSGEILHYDTNKEAIITADCYNVAGT